MFLRPVIRFAGKFSKHGNDLSECEDSFARGDLTFAVADGASDGIYSDIWARILADSYCREGPQQWTSDQFAEWITCRPRMEWQEFHDTVAAKSLPWFAREKLRQGSFATFAGISFASDLSGAWQACSYGDACLFVVRNDALLLAFPIASSDSFNNSPPLIATLGDVLPEHVRIEAGLAQPGDSFYLATDALAQWFLAETEHGDKPWMAFDTGISNDADLKSFVTEYREQKRLKNDDVTLVSIEIRVQE
jgi:hypothetical protein